MLNISHISPPPSCCTRRILNIFLNFFSTFFSGFFFSWTGRRRFACQLQLLLLLAKTEMRSHGAFIQGSWPNGPEKTTPSISHLCTLGSTLFYYYVFWVWVSYSHLHINLFAFVRAVLSSFPAFPTFPLFPFSWHFIAYFWESVAKCISHFPHCCVRGEGEKRVDAARNQAKICLAFSFVFARGVPTAFSRVSGIRNLDLASGFLHSAF